jgi:hypothetical protein
VLIGVAVSAALGLAVPATAAMHATKEFESGATRPRSIAFLPAHVNVIRRKIVQAEPQIEESNEFSVHLRKSLADEFAKQGYRVRVLAPEEVNVDPELQEMVLDADRRYTELLKQIQLKLPRQIAKRRYQAGDEMRTLAAKLGVDAIGFADMTIVASAAGASAVAVLVGFGAAGSQVMESVSLIDGKSANIEAYFVPPALRRGSMAGYDAIVADPAGKIGQMTQLTLRDLPKVDAAAAPKSGDDDVVEDVESLLKDDKK